MNRFHRDLAQFFLLTLGLMLSPILLTAIALAIRGRLTIEVLIPGGIILAIMPITVTLLAWYSQSNKEKEKAKE